MTVAQIAVFVESLQGFDGILVDALDVTQNDFSHIIGGLFAGIELLVQLEKLRDVLTTATVLWDFSFLKDEDILQIHANT